MKVLSLFDGVSCARVALERAGIPVEAYYASEIDKYAIQVSQKNYPESIHVGSVTDIYVEKGFLHNDSMEGFEPIGYVKDSIDLLIGGSPCQDLSIAGKREGLAGKKSGLFYEYVRILNEVKPKYFILENVNSMPKEAKETITKELFGIEPIMINASLVSAQNRKRLVWGGKRIDIYNSDNTYSSSEYEKVEVLLPEDKGIVLKDILEENVDEKYFLKTDNEMTSKDIHDSNVKVVGTLDQGTWSKRYEQIRRVYSVDGQCPTIPTAQGGGVLPKILIEPVALRNRGQGKKPEYNGTGKANSMTTVQTDSMVAFVIPEATKKGYAIATEGQSVDLSFPTSKTRRGRVGDKVKNIMTSQNIGVVQNMQIRKLTPIECERLQGVPDNYTDGISNSQRYKCLGNAFNVDVIAHILSFIK